MKLQKVWNALGKDKSAIAFLYYAPRGIFLKGKASLSSNAGHSLLIAQMIKKVDKEYDEAMELEGLWRGYYSPKDHRLYLYPLKQERPNIPRVIVRSIIARFDRDSDVEIIEGYDPYAKRKQQKKCKHEWEFKEYGRNKAGKQTVKMICYKCGKKKEMSQAQMYAQQKMQDGRRAKAYRKKHGLDESANSVARALYEAQLIRSKNAPRKT